MAERTYTQAEVTAIADGYTKLMKEFNRVREATLKQDEVLKKITKPPHSFGLVMQVQDDSVVLSFRGSLVEIKFDKDTQPLRRGDVVRLSDKGVIVNVAENIQMPGRIGAVFSVYGETAEVDIDGTRAFVACNVKAEIGDKVVIESSGSAIVKNLGRPPSPQTFSHDTGVAWDDIGGLVDAKRALREAIEQPILNKKLYEAYGRRPTRGVLLYGPPGCGKTMLGKASATALARLHGQTAKEGGFVYLKGPEVLNKYVGESEATIRALFADARKHHKQNGYPAVLFIDEAESLFGTRGDGNSSFMTRTIVPTLLAEMDGLEASGALVLLATNRPDDLDPAVVRDGRIDQRIKVGRPSLSTTRDIVMLNLTGVPTADQPESIASHCASELFADYRRMMQIRFKNGETADVNLGHMVNGAMIAGVIERAKAAALSRDIADSHHTARGILVSDIDTAIDSTAASMADVNNRQIVEEMVPDLALVASIHKIKEDRS